MNQTLGHACSAKSEVVSTALSPFARVTRSIWLLGHLLCLSYPLSGSEGESAPTMARLATHRRVAQGFAVAQDADIPDRSAYALKAIGPAGGAPPEALMPWGTAADAEEPGTVEDMPGAPEDRGAAEDLVARLRLSPEMAPAFLGKMGFSSTAITAALIDTHYRALRPALATALAYHPNLLRLVHAAGAHASTAVSNDLVRLIWDWLGSRALGTPLDQIENDYAVLDAYGAIRLSVAGSAKGFCPVSVAGEVGSEALHPRCGGMAVSRRGPPRRGAEEVAHKGDR